MFKTTLISTTIMVAALVAASAHAQDTAPKKYYVAGGYAHANPGSESDGYNALTVSAGIQVSKHFAFEGEASVGVTTQTYHVGGYDIDVKLDNSLALYAVGSLPVSPNVDLTARVGYLKYQVSAKTGAYKATDTEKGPAFGIGMRYFPKGGVNGIRADITHFDFGDDGDGNAFQLAYVRKF